MRFAPTSLTHSGRLGYSQGYGTVLSSLSFLSEYSILGLIIRNKVPFLYRRLKKIDIHYRGIVANLFSFIF